MHNIIILSYIAVKTKVLVFKMTYSFVFVIKIVKEFGGPLRDSLIFKDEIMQSICVKWSMAEWLMAGASS